MTTYSDNTLSQYLEKLSLREPVPGGGSAAAVSAGLGAALIAMAARYSLGKGKAPDIEARIGALIVTVVTARSKFIDLAGRDAQAYLDMVRARKSGDAAALKLATEEASRVPRDITALCRECLALTPFLHQEGNPRLLSDVKAAEAFLNAAIAAAGYMQEANS